MISVQPDVTTSLIIGDCLTNIRAALDHVMFRLALRYFDPPFDISNRSDRKNSSFLVLDPNAPDEQRFTYLSRRMPKATDAVDIIRSVQPDRRGYEPLWWLSELVNTDKHRLLLVTRSDIETSRIAVSVYDYQVGAADSTHGYNHIDIIKLAGLSHDAYSSELPPNVKMKCDPTIYVTLKDVPMPLATIKSEPIDSVLKQIIDTVTDIVSRFDRFFV